MTEQHRGYQGIVGPDGKSALPGGLYDMAELSENAALDDEVEEKLSALFKSEIEEAKAKFKLEVCFRGRSDHKPYFGMIMAWTNGGFLHGGGDEVVYFCPTKINRDNGVKETCAEPLHLQFVSKRVAVCPKCKTAMNPRDLVGQIQARLTTQNWVTLMMRIFTKLGCDADLILEHIEDDMRVANEKEQERDRGGEIYDAVRAKRVRIAYPLKNILKDTEAGASIESRIRAFLTA